MNHGRNLFLCALALTTVSCSGFRRWPWSSTHRLPEPMKASVSPLPKGDIEAVLPDIKGGGGSDFNPAFNVLVEENNNSVVLAFTDGFISAPAMQPDSLKGVLWCLTGEGTRRPVEWGRAITINKEGFAEEA